MSLFSSELFVRTATAEDASDICKVTIAAIKTCVADHENSSAVIEEWCANKNEGNVREWISNADNITLVAVDKDNVVKGIILFNHQNHKILLCYVDSAVHHRGIGRLLLKSIEQRALEKNIAIITVSSTKTAEAFYKINGYVILQEEVDEDTGRPSILMRKKI